MRDTKGDTSNRPAAPDYRSACVAMFGVNLAWIFIALWAVWGFWTVLVTGYALAKWIDRIDAARG